MIHKTNCTPVWPADKYEVGRFEKPCNCGRLESALDRKRVKRCNCFCSHCCNDCIPSGSQWEVRFENQRDRDACKLLFGNHTLQQGRFRFLTNKRFMLSRPSISCLGSEGFLDASCQCESEDDLAAIYVFFFNS